MRNTRTKILLPVLLLLLLPPMACQAIAVPCRLAECSLLSRTVPAPAVDPRLASETVPYQKKGPDKTDRHSLTKRVFELPLLDYILSPLTDRSRFAQLNDLHTLLDDFHREVQPLDARELDRLVRIEAFRRQSGENASILRYRSFNEDQKIVNYMFHHNRSFYLVLPEHRSMMFAVPNANGFTKYDVSSDNVDKLLRYIQLARASDIHF